MTEVNRHIFYITADIIKQISNNKYFTKKYNVKMLDEEVSLDKFKEKHKEWQQGAYYLVSK